MEHGPDGGHAGQLPGKSRRSSIEANESPRWGLGARLRSADICARLLWRLILSGTSGLDGQLDGVPYGTRSAPGLFVPFTTHRRLR
jgi:hypothetical protein